MSIEKIEQGDTLTQSKDLVADNIEKLKQLFPEIVTEGKIDFKVLQDVLGEAIEDEDEYYRFTWAGKAQARREAHKPSTGTLRPVKEDSLDWDTTENLYIEGDNLEVLKLLQKSYAGKVKMIYIDPPYNTGKDFVYKDNYKDNLKNYQELTGQLNSEGNKLSTNSDSDGRYHSNWLNMMYPRLRLARNLLKDDGVIFMSIDDNEVENLKKIGNEIFGEENFIAEIIREAIRGGSQSKNIRVSHDYIICFSKNINKISFTGREVDGIVLNLEDERGRYAKGRELNKWGAGSRREDSPSMYFAISGPNGEEVFPIRNDGSDGRWRLGKEKMHQKVKDGDVIYEKRENGTYIVYEKLRDDSPRIKQFTTLFTKDYINAKGTETIKNLFKIERSYFDYVKPIELMNDLLLMSAPNNNDIVVDFFSGSASTAHSVIKYNVENEGNVKYIMVQLPESCPENSEASKANYKTIPEIAKDRLRKIKEVNLNSNVDLGFKVFKLDSSNIKTWDGNPNELEANLWDAVSNIKDDRTEEDVLYEILLKYGLDLTLPIEEKTIEGKTVFNVGFGALFICLGDNLTSKVTEGIGKWKEDLNPEVCRVIFKDTGFTDVEKTNAVQTLKRYGITEIKSI
ncbi:site-specific DNA-methyltransferase [Tenacibaculum agarivorans]|uniref:site-specific DNA-methyltransferase n=1 Tax=Tenacibaculum agarivorans TaxID=1908389 RepID=UPI00094B8E95|nr:site-specific DNA-methyltransferase [Tenacibaculum agarivorans]